VSKDDEEDPMTRRTTLILLLVLLGLECVALVWTAVMLQQATVALEYEPEMTNVTDALVRSQRIN
jgi:hypothetical protein